MMKLYCFGESGNAYKAALTLSQSGTPWEPVWVDFFHGATRSAEFLEINEMGEVPVLVDGDQTLTQSGLIQHYVAEKAGKLLGNSAEDARACWRWILFDNLKVSGTAGPLRFNMNFLPEDRRNEAVNAYLSMRMGSGLKVLERVLSKSDWLVGDAVSIADFANCGYLFYEEPFTFDRKAYPAVDAWLSRISELPGWQHPYDMMPGSPADRA